MPGALTFILNDETQVNSYGFRVKNSGLNLDRFKSNPVMLDLHNSYSNDGVIGRWTNVRVDGNLLLADAEFDEGDDRAMKLKGKVERGYIKGASLGLKGFQSKDFVMAPDGNFDLERAEPVEASIVGIPSNAKSLVHLYDDQGKLMEEEAIKLSFQSIMQNSNITNMKFNLSVATMAALSLESTDDVNAVQLAIEKMVKKHIALSADLDSEKRLREGLEAKLSAFENQKAESLVDNAITEGRITADKKEKFLSLAKQDYDSAKEIIEAIPAKASLAAQVAAVKPNESEVKTMDDFEKLSMEAKLAFKQENPEAYAKLFNL